MRWESLDNLPTALKSRFFLQFNKEVQLIDFVFEKIIKYFSLNVI